MSLRFQDTLNKISLRIIQTSNLKRHIPNFLTCLNLFCGCIAVVLVFRNHLEWSGYLVFVAAFFDLMDGMAARKLNVASPIGKELDSLADVISFGFVPGAILFKMMQLNIDSVSENENLNTFLQFFPFVITIFSALRLAKFNIDTRQTNSFLGLPTPANTLLIVSFPLILANDDFNLSNLLLSPWFIIVITILQSALMVSELPLIALKFKNFSWKENSYQYILVIISAILLILLHFTAIPPIIFLYVLLSLLKKNIYKSEISTDH
jgi:CDP-diacylglycerol--serine O-phosphatidyltransferase